MINKELIEFMQINRLGENINLSKLIEDIVPLKEKKFTDIEIEVDKEHEFSLVLYQKESFFNRFCKSIKIGIEKINIVRHSKNFELGKNSKF